MLEQKGLRQSDLARKAGVTKQAISGLVTGRRSASPDMLSLIAQALGLPDDLVFRAAGVLPQEDKVDPVYEELIHKMAQLPAEEADEIAAFIELKLAKWERKNKRNGTAGSAGSSSSGRKSRPLGGGEASESDRRSDPD